MTLVSVAGRGKSSRDQLPPLDKWHTKLILMMKTMVFVYLDKPLETPAVVTGRARRSS